MTCLVEIWKYGESIKHIYLEMTLFSVLEKLSNACMLEERLQLTDECKLCLSSGKILDNSVKLLGHESLHTQANYPLLTVKMAYDHLVAGTMGIWAAQTVNPNSLTLPSSSMETACTRNSLAQYSNVTIWSTKCIITHNYHQSIESNFLIAPSS